MSLWATGYVFYMLEICARSADQSRNGAAGWLAAGAEHQRRQQHQREQGH